MYAEGAEIRETAPKLDGFRADTEEKLGHLDWKLFCNLLNTDVVCYEGKIRI